MDKDTQRAVRRHHAARVKANRKNYWGLDSRASERMLGKVAATPKQCSCWQCANPRKLRGELTIQEMVQQQIADSYRCEQ